VSSSDDPGRRTEDHTTPVSGMEPQPPSLDPSLAVISLPFCTCDRCPLLFEKTEQRKALSVFQATEPQM
jgi:hypothetical protein